MNGGHMSTASARKGSLHRPGLVSLLALAAAAVWGLPPAARGMEDEPAADTGKVRIEGAVTRPVGPQESAGKPVVVILGETRKSRRTLVTALPMGAGYKASTLAARGGVREVEKSITSQFERYDEWVKAEDWEEVVLGSGGVLVLEQAMSGIEVSCPRDVSAGGKIIVEVEGVGTADDTWDAWLVYPLAGDNPGEGPTPDGSRYEQQVLKTGAKAGGAKKLTAAFKTYPADKGKLLGVCVKRAKSDEKRVFWVQVR